MQSHTAAAPARPKEAGHAGREAQRRPYYGMLLAFASGCIVLAGCGPTLRSAIDSKTITNARASGFLVMPAGMDPVTPKFGVGTMEWTFNPTSTSTIRAPALVNRLDVGLLGSRTISTTAQGDIGNEMEKAGPTLVQSLEALHGRSTQQPAAAP